MPPSIADELGFLREIAVHAPGPELDQMTPDNIVAHCRDASGALVDNPDYLLFDDLVQLSRMRAEHGDIVRVLRATCGRQHTHSLRDMLRTVLYDDTVRANLVQGAVDLDLTLWGHRVDAADRSALEALDPFNLLPALVRGTLPGGRRVLRWPLPNLMFTRDLAAVVGRHVLLTHAFEPARRREMLLARAMVRAHRAFADANVLDIAERVDSPALEGGDIIVLSADQVAIGVGKRTSAESARAAADMLLENGVCQHVYLVALRPARSTMHLDTVFTIVDRHVCLAYAPIVCTAGGAVIHSVEQPGRVTPRRGSLLGVLKEDGLALTPIVCGGADPVAAAREQWSDGANAFALAPGKILLYARNEHTLRSLNRAGFEVLTPDEWCRNAALLLRDPGRRIVVAIDGSELSRGRGGPRCLTLPIRRDP